jgi:uncharacterized protein YlxW (UPF0749 family)
MPKISQLPTLINITTGSIIPVVENFTTQKLSVGKLFEFLSGALDETFATEVELLRSASGITSSFEAFTSSVDARLDVLETPSLSISASQITALGFATTGSNTFTQSQTISAGNSLLVNRIENTTGGNIEIAASGLLSLSGDSGGVKTNDNFEANPGGNNTFKVTSGSVSITGSISATGTPLISSSTQITALGFISESITDTGSLLLTSSFNSFSSSVNNTTQSLNNSTSSLNTFSASVIATGSIINTFSSSVNTTTASLNSFSASVNSKTGSYATTGSNVFSGNQTISDSLIVSEIVSTTAPAEGDIASAGETGITYLTGDLAKWAIFREDAFTIGVWTDVVAGWTVTDNNGFTDIIAGRGSFGAASFQTTANNWPAPASGRTYVFTSPDYQPESANPLEITIGNNDWVFEADGGLTFPDETTQTTAFIPTTFATTSSFNELTASLSGVISSSTQITALGFISESITDTGSLLLTSSFNDFSSSVHQRLLDATNEQVIDGFLLTSSFNSYTSSNDGKWDTLGGQTGSFITEAETSSFVTNVSMFLSKSAFDTYTSSLNSFSSSVNSTTQSLNNFTASVIATGSIINTFTASVNTTTASLNSKTGSYAKTGSNTFVGNQIVSGTLTIATNGGDEGGEILLGKAVTNTTLTGSGVVVDIFRDRVRIFEESGTTRGAFLNVASQSAGVSSQIVTSPNLFSIQTITSASYAALTPVSGTLYVIIG